jgi:hypothetical protein
MLFEQTEQNLLVSVLRDKGYNQVADFPVTIICPQTDIPHVSWKIF